MSENAVQVKEKKESLLSKKNLKIVTDPFLDNNPITIQVLGICSALAVTSKLDKAIVMSIAVVFVLTLANLTISVLRKAIPPQIRMIVELVVVAALVTLVSELLHAFQYAMYKDLSVYIGLIITNCIVMGRLEAFAMANSPGKAIMDGIGNGLGYGGILIAVAFFRELFGMGTLMGVQIMPASFVNNGLMVMPAAAMFLIGIFIWIQRSVNKELVDIS